MLKQFSGISVQGRCFPQKTTLSFFTKEDERLALVYGANGSGKSTISTAFRTLLDQESSELVVAPAAIDGNEGITTSLPVFIFDEKYIDNNVKIDDDGLGSIVLLGAQVELQAQIDDTLEKLQKEQSKLQVLQTTQESYNAATNPLSPTYHWNNLKAILKGVSEWAKRDSEIKGNKQNTAVTDAIVEEICSLEVIKTQEDLLTEYSQKKAIFEQTAALNPIYNTEIRQLVLKQDTDKQLIELLTLKLEEPRLSDREQLIFSMVQSGHQGNVEHALNHFSVTQEDYCPYCFQTVTERYKESLVENIRRVLNKEVDQHKEQFSSFRMMDIPDVYDQYSELDDEIVKKLHKAIKEYTNIVQQYKMSIDAKLQNVYTPILQPSLGLKKKIEEINSLIVVLEKKRKTYVQISQNRNKLKKELISINKQLAAIYCADTYKSYHKQFKDKQKADLAYEKQEKTVKLLQAQLDSLNHQKENIVLAIDYINESLAYVFFSKDRLSIELRGDKYYLKSRGQDVIPKNVSQGERNIIALCYFFVQISANMDHSKLYKNEQLLIIDDPISSFDFDNKVGIISLLRKEIKKVIFGNNNSKVLILTHDLPTMFDVKKAFDEIGNAAKAKANTTKASSRWLELKNGELVLFRNDRSEYALLLEKVYQFAIGNDTDDLLIGNTMRRVLEAFSTFCYKKSIEDISTDSEILSLLGVYAEYFENRMYRLVLHGESHFKEQVYDFHDSERFYTYFSKEEKRKTARDVLCFMSLLNKQHIKVYLPQGNKQINEWCNIIHSNLIQLSSGSQKMQGIRNSHNMNKVKLYDIPLSAGIGIDMLDNDVPYEDYETVEKHCDFALRIRGDSMEPDIPNNSIVLIHQQESINPNEIGAFLLNGNVYCKKLSIINGKTQLSSNNTHYLPITVDKDDSLKCYGKVIKIIVENNQKEFLQ